MADRTFGARYDRLTKMVSAAVVVLLVAVPLVAAGSGWIAALVALFSAAVLALSFAFSPRGYEISGEALRVRRLAGDVVFPLHRLRFLRHATAWDFWGCVRLWGSGGLFGYYGWFWSKALGRSRWFVTDRGRAVVLADGGNIILVSPEDRDAFVSAIQHADAETRAVSLQAASRRISPLAIGLAITGLTVALVAAALLYAPGPPPLELTPNSLVIHSRFYGMTVPASSVDVANVRVVDLRVEKSWKPVRRTNGFGNQHYAAGNFQTASGRAVKLFSAGAPRLVLLPPMSWDGTPVLLDAADPDRFAARVRYEWGRR